MKLAPEEQFLDCVHCGLCLTACPTYLETGLEADSPRGRIYMMRGLQDGRLARVSRPLVRHLDLCLGCRACETACPSGVRYGSLIESARPVIEKSQHRPWIERGRRRLIGHFVGTPSGQRWLSFAARWIPRGLLARASRARRCPPGLRYRFGLAAALPAPTSGRWTSPAASRVSPTTATFEPSGRVRGRVVLFPGCLGRAFFDQTNRRATALLSMAGFRVYVPSQPLCCGALLHHLGRPGEASGLADRAVQTLSSIPADAIVTTAAGCGAMLKDLAELVRAPDARRVADRVRDVTEFLANADLPRPVTRIEQRVTYHDACHLAHAQGVRLFPRALLEGIPGIELVDLVDAEQCCGSAGTYNLTEPSMARRLMERKIDNLLATGAEIVAAANPGCLVQIRAGLAMAGSPMEAVHPIDLLARAHGV